MKFKRLLFVTAVMLALCGTAYGQQYRYICTPNGCQLVLVEQKIDDCIVPDLPESNACLPANNACLPADTTCLKTPTGKRCFSFLRRLRFWR